MRICRASPTASPCRPLTISSQVDDADALYATSMAAGVEGRFVAPQRTAYGLHEFAHIDPDGNQWRVGSTLDRGPR